MTPVTKTDIFSGRGSAIYSSSRARRRDFFEALFPKEVC
jgi:hypothetical protein